MSEDDANELGADGLTDEVRSVRRKRYDEARSAGMSIAEAQLFRDSDIDVSWLRKLVDGQCPPALIQKILL